MTRVPKMLNRYLSWFSTDHLAVVVSIYYGVFIWTFHSFIGSSAFSAMAVPLTANGIPPEPIFALPLIIGAVLHGCGIRRESHGLMAFGLVLSFAVWAAALVSCFLMPPHTSTGVPAYSGYVLAYGLLTLRHAVGNQWIPIA